MCAMTASHVELIGVHEGRHLAIHRLADGDTRRTVVLCHPAPGAGVFDPDPEQTLARGITLLAVDRPGYGQSEPLPATHWPSVSSAADDLATALDRAGSGPVGVAGWSAGGRVALALAARRPDLIDRVAIIGTPAPHEQVPWIPPEQQAMLDQLRGLPAETVRAALLQQLAALIPRDPGDSSALSLLAASDADDAALARPGARPRLARMLEAAFAQGATGLASDIAGYSLHPWGFALHEVQAKTLLLYGAKDPVAGTRHGTWWQKHLPNARLEVVPGAGHLLILTMWQRILSHLAPHTKRQR